MRPCFPNADLSEERSVATNYGLDDGSNGNDNCNCYCVMPVVVKFAELDSYSRLCARVHLKCAHVSLWWWWPMGWLVWRYCTNLISMHSAKHTITAPCAIYAYSRILHNKQNGTNHDTHTHTHKRATAQCGPFRFDSRTQTPRIPPSANIVCAFNWIMQIVIAFAHRASLYRQSFRHDAATLSTHEHHTHTRGVSVFML